MENYKYCGKNITLISSHLTRSIRWFPKFLVDRIAESCAKKGKVEEKILSSLFSLYKNNYHKARELTLDGKLKDEEKFVFIIKQLQKKPLCRGSWCPLYHDHGIQETIMVVDKSYSPCLSIGAFQEFLLSYKIIDASRRIDEYFRGHQISLKSFSPPLLLRSVIDEIRDYKWRRNNSKNLHLLMDHNTLEEDQIKELYRYAQRTGEITPFVIPKWEDYYRDSSIINDKWKDFVTRQIKELFDRSVVVLNLCCDLRSATDTRGNLDENMNVQVDPRGSVDQNMRVDSRNEAVRFIRRQLELHGRMMVDVSSSNMNNQPQGDDEEEPEEEQALQRDCDHGLKIETLLEALLMCPYWAHERSSSSKQNESLV